MAILWVSEKVNQNHIHPDSVECVYIKNTVCKCVSPVCVCVFL